MNRQRNADVGNELERLLAEALHRMDISGYPPAPRFQYHAMNVVGPAALAVGAVALIAFIVYRLRKRAVESRRTSAGGDGE